MRRTGKKKYLQKNALKWYKLAKVDTGVERCEVSKGSGEESVKLFRLSTGSAGLLGDKK